MAIPKVTFVCLSGVAMLAGAEARLNAPTLDPRSWIPMVDDILLGKLSKTTSVTGSPSRTTIVTGTTTVTGHPSQTTTVTGHPSQTTTVTRMPAATFLRALVENVYLNKLLFAAQRGETIPEQHRTYTSPVDLLENIPFPFSLISNGLKTAAEAAGVDLESLKRTLQFNYEDKYGQLINHGILPPNVLAQAVDGLDARSFMALVPALDQDYIQTLREFLPPQLSTIPSVQEVMGVFGVQADTEAEASLRSLFPFFDLEMIESYMRMAADGLPIPQISTRSEGESTDEDVSYRMWIPFLDEVLLNKYLAVTQDSAERSSLLSVLEPVTNLLPLPASLTGVLGL